MVTSSVSAECGPLALEFFNSEQGTPIDETIFRDDRTNSPENVFTVRSVEGDDYRYGSYPILYRLYYSNYPDVQVE